MKIGLTADYDGSINIDKLLFFLFEEMSKYFTGKDYGNNKVEIFMVIICYPKDLKLRKRFDNKEKVLYWDIMLDYQTLKKAKKDEKKAILAQAIISSFDVLDKYENLHLNKDKLKDDARQFFKSIEWLK